MPSEEKQSKLIGVGSPIVDSITHVTEAFISHIHGAKGGMQLVNASEMKRLIESIEGPIVASPGGSAGNTTFAVSRMGLASKFLGKLGHCQQGQWYREQFEKQGGNSGSFKIADQANGHCLSMVTPDGERTMRTDLGAAMLLSPDEVSVEDFSDCQHAHFEGYLLFNEALTRKLLSCAQAANCTISLDLASFEVVQASKSILPELLEKYVDIVFANEDETAAFCGVGKDYAEMAQSLQKFCSIAAVKMGAAGAYIADGQAIKAVPAYKVDTVVDTTAAGDLWAAGFLYGWLQQWPLSKCAQLGAKMGAAVVQIQGSQLPEATWGHLMQWVQRES
jgi:sugar/nucleoside kinase (ribokinase family)